MDFLQAFNEMMAKQTQIALATSTNNIPNVRIVNFYYDPTRSGVLYFATFKDNRKIEAFKINNQVAFTTIPLEDTEHIKVTQATVAKSDLTLYDIQDGFIKKIPDYASTIEYAGDQLELYEIHFTEACVTIDFEHIHTIFCNFLTI